VLLIKFIIIHILHPFVGFLELDVAVPVRKRTRSEINQARGIFLNLIPDDVVSIITSVRGMECCSLENCPRATNIVATFIEFKDSEDERWFGACVICRSHYAQIDMHFLMPIGTHIYILDQPWQQELRQNL